MPGLGRKTFIATEVLTAANVNGYLMDQTVMVFAGTAARSSAIGTAVSEGMVSFLTDSDSLQYYNGSAWTNVDTSGGSGNAIINGAFDIWQRGTTITNPGLFNLIADRWLLYNDGTGGTRTVSQQTFTPGAAPISGYEGTFFLRYNESVATTGSSNNLIDQRIEDVRMFAGQTMTFSFFAKADAARTVGVVFDQNFGSGGSTTVVSATTNFSLTTAWQRFTVTIAMPSISGKTIGTGSFLQVRFSLPRNVIQTIDIWGVQLEAGSTATAFKRNASNIQGELAACQRYFQTYGGYEATGNFFSSSAARLVLPLKVTMRVAPTMTYPTGTLTNYIDQVGVGARTPSAISGQTSSINAATFDATGMSGGTGGYLVIYVGAQSITASAEI